ncbi:hypothetical protein I5U08_22545 [Stenotrophomonas maltophilia]|nr:hypothetical protein [Stenotrophomonas maltophilia]
MDVTMRFGLMLFSWVIAAPVLAGECQFDNRAELLAMPPDAFNQGPGEGWDALVERAGCSGVRYIRGELRDILPEDPGRRLTMAD